MLIQQRANKTWQISEAQRGMISVELTVWKTWQRCKLSQIHWICSVSAPHPESGSIITIPHLFHTQQVHGDWKSHGETWTKDSNPTLTHVINWAYICQYFYQSKVSNNPNLIRRHTAGDGLWIVKSITCFFFGSRNNRRVKTQRD